MSKGLQTLDASGAQVVTTLTKAELEAARAESDVVHVVQHERTEGGWE